MAKPINRYGNSAATRELIPRLQRTVRDAQVIAKRHKDNELIQQQALALAELCRGMVRTTSEQ